jgi:ATP-binding cassette subfamily B protein
MRSAKQHLKSDCAAACLTYVARHHGLRVSTAAARRLAGSTVSGTTALGLVQAAEKLGLTAKGLRGGPGLLASCPVPAIVHVKLSSGRTHYLVLIRHTGRRLRVMDPADGSRSWYDLESFQALWSGVLIVLAPGEKFEPGDRTVPPLSRLVRMLLGHKSTLTQMLAGAVVLSALGLAMSFYVQRLVDDVLPASNRPLLNLLGAAMAALIAARLVLGWFQFIFSFRLTQRIDGMLILGYYRHLLRLPQSFFDTMRVGEMTSRINDAVQIRSFLSSVLVSLVLNPVILVFSFAAMFCYSGRLALLTLSQVPLQLLIYWWINRLNRKYQRAIKERAADLSSHVTESLHTVSTSKRFSLEEAVTARTEARFVRLLRTNWRAGLGGFWCSTASGLGSQLYSLAILWYGASLALDAVITPGQLMSSYTLAMYVSGSLAGLVGLSADLQQALIASDRLFEIMDEAHEPSGGTVVLGPEFVGTIAFENVTLRHPGRLPALREVTLAFPAGKISVVTGESGCGKSTLFAVLQRLYLPESGNISIGKIDFDYLSTASLRTALSVLPQRVELVAGSILANIAVGVAAPDLVRVSELCAELGILDFINSLPQKFSTSLSEGGLALSGGQRQRLALARTFYRCAPIVLLDEPTTALDRDAIEHVTAMMLRLRAAGTTVIAATHSRSILAIADHVVVLKAGRVVPAEAREGAESSATEPALAHREILPVPA